MPASRHLHVLALSMVMGFGAASGAAQSTQSGEALRGAAAFGDWRTDAPGVRRHITVADLPAPNESTSADNPPRLVRRPEGTELNVPAGFKVEQIATGLNNPRRITTAPNGDLFVAESAPGRIKVLRLGPDGKTAATEIFAEKLSQPFGIAFYPPGPDPEWVYVANTGSVVRFAYKNGDLKARGSSEMIVPDLPGGGRLRGGGHWTRDVVFTNDGKKMFVSVGSLSNVDDGPTEKNRASILEYNPDGSGFRVYASGVRNAVGLAIEPSSGALWASVNERDGLGDDMPFEYVTRIQENGFYGWPWYYIGNHQDPRHKGKHPDLAEKVIVPDVLIQAHSASLCMTFYSGRQFPERYHGWAFAAQHGSWNRTRRTGYKLICMPVINGKATGEYEDFLTGFVTDKGDVWGRPVGVTMDNSGGLILVDDGSNSIWRIWYAPENSAKEAATTTAPAPRP